MSKAWLAGLGALAVLVALGAWWVASSRVVEPSVTPVAVDAAVSDTVSPAVAEPEAVAPPVAVVPVPEAADASGTVPLTEAEFLVIAEQAARGDTGPAAAGRMCAEYCAGLGEGETAPEVRLAGARYLHLGQAFAEAEEQARLLLDEHPEARATTDALYTVGRAQLMQFREDEARETFQEYAAACPDAPDADRALYLAMMITFQKGDRSGAERMVAEIESRYPESKYLYHAKQKLTGKFEE